MYNRWMIWRVILLAALLLPTLATGNEDPAAPAQAPEIAEMKIEGVSQSPAVDISTVKTLSQIMEAVAPKRILYVGEVHDRFSHHATQLQAIREMYKRNTKTAIGMEMFQAPFQGVLDEYIEGKIDEREFLQRSEYFKRWGYDYNLYKAIMDFAREEKIPVVALNVRREIVGKVSKGGVDSLSEEEKKEIPQEMDFSDNEYKERLKEVFKDHTPSQERNFDFFYQSQIVWDESMAESIADFFKRNPDYQESGQMIVLAGGGHLMYGSGIPKRTFRRNGYGYAIILNEGVIERDVADYVIFPKPLEGTTSPKMMALLNESGGTVNVMGFPEDSVSEKAGLRVDDRITALDDLPVKTVDDVRIHLFYKKKGDSLKVKVVRKRFLFGDKSMEFEVVL